MKCPYCGAQIKSKHDPMFSSQTEFVCDACQKAYRISGSAKSLALGLFAIGMILLAGFVPLQLIGLSKDYNQVVGIFVFLVLIVFSVLFVRPKKLENI